MKIKTVLEITVQICVRVSLCLCVVHVPHVWAHGVGGALQRPCEQSELPSEAFLIKAFGVRRQQVQVLAERTECVFATAVDHVAKRRLHRRHVLR